MDKRQLILDALGQLFQEGKAGTASVSDIAKRAGIAKGGMYYYFRSKEEVLDALVEREYQGRIAACARLVDQCPGDATKKLQCLLVSYQAAYVDPSLDACLHMQKNAAIHQKSLAQILTSLTGIVTGILEQGVREGIYACDHPQGYAQIVLSAFAFLLDPGIFPRTSAQRVAILAALSELLEKGLGAKPDSFSFLYTP